MAEWEVVEGWDWGPALGKGLCGVVVEGSRSDDPSKTKVFFFFVFCFVVVLLLFNFFFVTLRRKDMSARQT